jgi:hypothetical protein
MQSTSSVAPVMRTRQRFLGAPLVSMYLVCGSATGRGSSASSTSEHGIAMPRTTILKIVPIHTPDKLYTLADSYC